MTALVEKLVAEIIVSLCVGVVLGLISPILSTPDEVIQQNRRLVCRRCGSNDPTVSAARWQAEARAKQQLPPPSQFSRSPSHPGGEDEAAAT